MIQRIQSLYLLLAIVCFVLLSFFAPIQFLTPQETEVQQQYELSFFYLQNTTNAEAAQPVMSVWALSVLNILIPLLSLVSIFLYKKRILQVRLNVVNVFLMLGYYIVLGVYIYFACKQLGVDWYINVSAALPLVSLVLTMMAVRAILKDEALVRAADRLR